MIKNAFVTIIHHNKKLRYKTYFLKNYEEEEEYERIYLAAMMPWDEISIQ